MQTITPDTPPAAVPHLPIQVPSAAFCMLSPVAATLHDSEMISSPGGHDI